MQNITLKTPVRVASSEPTSPVPFQQIWINTAMEENCAVMTHKEYVAIQTIESIPVILMQGKHAEPQHVYSPAMRLSPAQLPLEGRMKAIFTSAMGRARLEAGEGPEGTRAAGDLAAGATPARGPPGQLQPGDIMSAAEVDAFVANLETSHVLDEKGGTVWMRRYHRVLKPGEARPCAGVPPMGNKIPEFIMPSVGQTMGAPDAQDRVAIAILELNEDGVAVGGWWRLPGSEEGA